MTGTLVDMHLHTINGASDSQLSPDDLLVEMRRIGLTGVNLSEHDRLWDRYQLNAFRDRADGLFINNGMEVSTDLGHMIAVGLREYVPGIRHCATLRKVLDDVGGYLIVAHPFRHFFDPVTFKRVGKEPPVMTPENMARLPVFEYVDAIEVLNGANTMRENLFALAVAEHLGKPGTGGSDAHSTSGIGIYCTVFERELTGEEGLIEELRAGRFYPALGLPQGEPRRFTLGADPVSRTA